MSLPIPCFLFLGLGLVIATFSDLKKRRIPNALTFALLIVGLAAQGIFHGPLAALSGLAAGMIVLLALYVPWNAGGIGGGDVKLAAATATWLGLGHIIPFALATAIAGGVVAFICYAVARPNTR